MCATEFRFSNSVSSYRFPSISDNMIVIDIGGINILLSATSVLTYIILMRTHTRRTCTHSAIVIQRKEVDSSICFSFFSACQENRDWIAVSWPCFH